MLDKYEIIGYNKTIKKQTRNKIKKGGQSNEIVN